MEADPSSNPLNYERIPYLGTVAPSSAPDHLSLCSSWHYGPCPPIQNFRLIELGCGDGANLLPLAFYDPKSFFIGIDSSSAAIALATEGARSLGLENVRFMLKDLRDVSPADFAPCDFVTAPGVYSWVPENVREALLEFCRQALTKFGLAYISYNAQPGWTIRRLVREILQRDQTVRKAAIEQKVARATEVAARYLEDLLPYRNYAFAVILDNELENVRSCEPSHVFHDYISETNEGFWLHDFVDISHRHGLDYVTDAQFLPWEGDVPIELMASLAKRHPDPIAQEEAADLFGPRYIHASILCRSDAVRSSATRRGLLNKVYIAACLKAKSDSFDLTEGVVERFFGRGVMSVNGPEVTLDKSITKAAVLLLTACCPKGMRLKKLHKLASQLLIAKGHEVPADSLSQLSSELLKLFEAEQIDLRMREPAYHTEIPEYAQANALARFEAQHRETLTTPYHIPLELESKALELVCALDGARSRTNLSQTFGEQLVQNTLTLLTRWGLLDTNLSF